MSVRVGVIGTGWWATRAHLPALEADPDAVVAGLADPNDANLRRAAARFGVARTFATAEALLDELAIDAAVVAVPHVHHARIARMCLERGLHVLLEKPMTIDPADAFALVDLARLVARELVIGYPWHYNGQILELRARLAEGAIGDIEAVTCLFASTARELYRGYPESYRETLGFPLHGPGASTYSDPDIAGGGQGQTQVSHAAALLLWLTGLQPRWVAAFTADQGLPVDLVDAATLSFDGGALGTLASTGSVLPGQDEILEYRIFGTRGHSLIDVGAGTASVHGPDGRVDHLAIPPPEERYPEWAPARNLVAVVGGRASNGSPAELGARTVALIDALYRSAASGRLVSMSRPAPSDEPDVPDSRA